MKKKIKKNYTIRERDVQLQIWTVEGECEFFFRFKYHQ